MWMIQGTGVSKGIVQGTLYFYKRIKFDIVKGENCNIEYEKARLSTAQKKTIFQLEQLIERCRKEKKEESAVLFEAYAMFMNDEVYLEQIYDIMETERCTAEYAVERAGAQFSSMLSKMNDTYMQARADDIQDISRRCINNLMGCTDGSIDSEIPVILAADDLSPSETVHLDKSKILGFVTKKGTANSHTAILARMMGIPAICGCGEMLKQELNHCLAYMDGENGTLIFEPEELILQEFKSKYDSQQKRKEMLFSMKGQEDVMLDGKRLNIYCNIGSVDEVSAVIENDGQGIGLFRSECFYLGRSDFPSEEELFQEYKSVACAMNGKQVIIRTLDIGADKQAAYFGIEEEKNPALGMRGIRVCLKYPEIFKRQLRALYRASAYGKIAIMFPMITAVWEVEECKKLCRIVRDELIEEKIPFDQEMQIGIMIETPASVFIADELAKLVDFFSVGTNDLTQYILACDRQSEKLGKYWNPYHPAVMQALKRAVDAAHKNGIWIGICGELGADLSMLPNFLTWGIDEISVVPSEVLPLRAAVRESISQTCNE